jgi:hypothetical protein
MDGGELNVPFQDWFWNHNGVGTSLTQLGVFSAYQSTAVFANLRKAAIEKFNTGAKEANESWTSMTDLRSEIWSIGKHQSIAKLSCIGRQCEIEWKFHDQFSDPIKVYDFVYKNLGFAKDDPIYGKESSAMNLGSDKLGGGPYDIDEVWTESIAKPCRQK